QSIQMYPEPQYAYPDAAYTYNGIRQGLLMQYGPGNVVIGRYERVGGMRQLLQEAVQSYVKIMVPHSGTVIPHHGHGLYFRLALVQVKIRRALEDISRIQQQYITLLGPYRVNDGFSRGHPAAAGKVLIGIGERVQPAVGIVGMQYHQPLALLLCQCAVGK